MRVVSGPAHVPLPMKPATLSPLFDSNLMNHLRNVLLLGLSVPLALAISAIGADKQKSSSRPQPPTRPFDAPGAPKFTRLDGKPGVNPPVDVDGNFVVGPEYVAALETKIVAVVPQGKVQQFSMDSKDCKLFNPGIAREVFGTVDPNNPKALIVETHPIDYKRTVTVYVPAQYVPGSAAPFIVTHDGPAMGKSMRSAPLCRVYKPTVSGLNGRSMTCTGEPPPERVDGRSTGNGRFNIVRFGNAQFSWCDHVDNSLNWVIISPRISGRTSFGFHRQFNILNGR